MGVVLIRHLLDEFIRLCQTAYALELLVRSVFVTPAKVFLDRAGEQHVLLEHHGNLIAQRLDIVIADIHAAYLDRAVRGIVQARNQLHERRLRGTGATENADGLTGLDMQIDVFERQLALIALVTEGNVIELDRAVLDLVNRVCGIVQVGLLIEDFGNTLCARLGHGDHNENHRYHHQAHQDLHRVGKHAGQLAGGHRAADDQTRAEPRNEQHARVHAELHQRHNACHGLLRLGERAVQHAGNALELFSLVVLTHIGLNNADAAHIFLYDRVHAVVDLECALKDRTDNLHQDAHADCQNRQHREEYERHPAVDLHRHEQCKDQHDRAAHRDARAHLKGVLYVGNIGGQTGDDRTGGELINVGKREILHIVVHIVTQIAGKAG